MSVQRVDLEPEDIIREAGGLTPHDLDRLPFGTIHLDRDGAIRIYNKAEEALSGRRREDVIGRNFFMEVAPCTQVKQFYGAFQEGVARAELNEGFDFSFHFETGRRDVRIRLIYSAHPEPGVWIFVTPLR